MHDLVGWVVTEPGLGTARGDSGCLRPVSEMTWPVSFLCNHLLSQDFQINAEALKLPLPESPKTEPDSTLDPLDLNSTVKPIKLHKNAEFEFDNEPEKAREEMKERWEGQM